MNTITFNNKKIPAEPLRMLLYEYNNKDFRIILPKSIFDKIESQAQFSTKELVADLKKDPTALTDIHCGFTLEGEFWDIQLLNETGQFVLYTAREQLKEMGELAYMCACRRRLCVNVLKKNDDKFGFLISLQNSKEYSACRDGKKMVLNCAKCDKASTELLTCSRCKFVKFCSRECQVASHQNHKQFCKDIAAERLKIAKK